MKSENLQAYFSWFLWEECVRRSGMERTGELSVATSSGAYELTRCRNEAAGEAPLGLLGG